jgi:hypothetical protein
MDEPCVATMKDDKLAHLLPEDRGLSPPSTTSRVVFVLQSMWNSDSIFVVDYDCI